MRFRKAYIVLASCLAAAALAAPTAGAAQWTAPVDVTAAGSTAYDAQLAVDPRGDAAAAWMHWNGHLFVVQAATRPAGGGWSAPVDLSGGVVSGSEPEIAIDPRGDATVVWQEYVTHFRVEVSSLAAGASAWSGLRTLSNPAREGEEPQVAMDLQGRATVVWEGEEAGGDHVIQASSEQIPGGSWTSPADLSAAGADAESAAIATDGFGGAVAVWERPTGGLETVQWAERSPAGSWSVPHVLSSMGEEAKQPRLAVDAAGDAAVIWDHDAGSNDVAEVTTRLAGGEWSAPEDISDPDGESHEARIGIDGQGDALAVWTASEPGGYVVEARETAVGGAAWGDPARISPTSLSELEPSLAMDPAGEAIVTMQATEGEGESVEAVTRAAATGPWSAPTVLSAPSGRATQSAVGVDAEGDAVALWRSYVSSNDNVIQSSDYIADRPPAGGAPAAGGPAPIVDPSPLGVPARTRCPKGKHLAKRKGKGKAKRARRICVKRAPRHHKRHQKPVRNRNSKGKR